MPPAPSANRSAVVAEETESPESLQRDPRIVASLAARRRFEEQADPSELQNLPVRSINEIRPFLDDQVDDDIRKFAIDQYSRYQPYQGQPYSDRLFPDVVMAWQAHDLYYQPLYFEDPALERYGHTYPFLVQSFVSSGRFFGQILTFPYHATIKPPMSKESPLGYYRPGECAPHLCYPMPWNTHAAIVQAAATVGLIFFIP